MSGVGVWGPRTSLDRVRAAIEARGLRPSKQAADFTALCPCHEEKTGSLHVTWQPATDGGRVVLHCFGCEAPTEAIVEALDLRMQDLFDEPLPEQGRAGRTPRQRRQGAARPTAGRLPARVAPRDVPAEPDGPHQWVEVTSYAYCDAVGTEVQRVTRRECRSCELPHKTFVQRFAGADGQLKAKTPTGFTPVLYRLPEVRAAVAAGEPVYLVEGEKDADTVAGLGQVATTNPGGGGVFTDAMADELAGAAVRVVLDRDETGWARGVRVHQQLTERGAIVVLLLPVVPSAKADLTDHVQAGHRLEDLVEVSAAEVAAWASVAAVAKAQRLVRECLEEAIERVRRSDAAAEAPAERKLERNFARRWAAAAAVRWEALADDAGATIRLAEVAGTSWAAEAGELAHSLLRHGTVLARETHEVAGEELPGELRPENTATSATPSTQPAAAPAGSPAPQRPPATRVRKLLPGQVRYEALDNALYEIRSTCRKVKDPATGEVVEEWEDKPKALLNLAPELVAWEYAATEDDVDAAPTMGRESRTGARKVRDATAPTHMLFRYRHPVTGEEEHVRVEHDDAVDGSWLSTLPIAGLSYDSGKSGRAKLWDAIRQTSQEAQASTLYRSTGWRELPEYGWGYVHAGGAITAKGNVAVPVHLTGSMIRFDLPDPLEDAAALRAAFREHTLGLFERLPARVSAVLIGHMFRAALTANPWTPVLVGPPGTYKTGVAALGMHFFGEAWDRDRPATTLSGNGDTFNALRWKLYQGKDAVTFCDDAAPTKDITAAQKLIEEVARMVHGKEGRTRLQRDGQDASNATPPRGSALLTSEVHPRPGSGEERLVPIPLYRGLVSRDAVVELDQDSSRHGRARVMATFLSWVAADLPLQRQVLAAEAETYTQALLAQGRDNRKADAYGQLWAGWSLLTRFLLDVDAITGAEREELLGRVDVALVTALEASVDPDVPGSTGGRVREMIAYALSSGLAHVLDAGTGDCPPWPLGARLGHRAVKAVGGAMVSTWTNGGVPDRTEPRGLFAGYVQLNPRTSGGCRELLLERLGLEQILKVTAGQLADAPQMDARTAMRALHDAGVLHAETQANGEPRYTKWRTVDCLADDSATKRRMVVLDLDKILGDDNSPGPDVVDTSPTPPPPAGDDDTEQPAPTTPGGPPVDVGPGVDVEADVDIEAGTLRTWTRSDGLTLTPRLTAEPRSCWGCRRLTRMLFADEPWHGSCWSTSDATDAPAGEDSCTTEADIATSAAVTAPTEAEELAPCTGCSWPTRTLYRGQPWHGDCWIPTTPTATSAPAHTESASAEPADAAMTTSPHSAPAARSSSPAVAASTDDAPLAEAAAVVPATVSATASPSVRHPAGTSSTSVAVAVADVDHVVLGDGTRHPLPEPCTHLGHLAAIAEQYSLSAVATRGHVEPGTVVVTAALAARMGLPVDELPELAPSKDEIWGQLTKGHPVLTDAIADGWSLGGSGASSLRGWVRVQHGTRKVTVRVAFAPLLQGGLVKDDPSPEQIARRLQLFADQVGYPWRVTPWVTGLDLLRGLRWKDREKLFTPVDPPPPALLGVEPDLNWSRVPYAEELQQRYVHVYDRGGSYAAGLAGLEVGIGAPVHHPDGVEFDKRVPGYFRVVVDSVVADVRMPAPLYVPRGNLRQDGTAWVTAPTVELAQSMDQAVEIVEAYVWPEHGRVFNSWYEKLRDARTALDLEDVDAQAARDMVKEVYAFTIGRMGSHQLHAGKTGYAPDRRHAIIAKARCNLLRRVHQIGTITGVWPVAISNDSVAYLSDDPDPVTAWPGKPEHFGRGLGQYKPEKHGLLAQHLPHLTGGTWAGKSKLVKTERWDPAAAGEL